MLNLFEIFLVGFLTIYSAAVIFTILRRTKKKVEEVGDESGEMSTKEMTVIMNDFLERVTKVSGYSTRIKTSRNSFGFQSYQKKHKRMFEGLLTCHSISSEVFFGFLKRLKSKEEDELSSEERELVSLWDKVKMVNLRSLISVKQGCSLTDEKYALSGLMMKSYLLFGFEIRKIDEFMKKFYRENMLLGRVLRYANGSRREGFTQKLKREFNIFFVKEIHLEINPQKRLHAYYSKVDPTRQREFKFIILQKNFILLLKILRRRITSGDFNSYEQFKQEIKDYLPGVVSTSKRFRGNRCRYRKIEIDLMDIEDKKSRARGSR